MTRMDLSDLRLVFPLVLWLTGCGSEALTQGSLTETFELRSVGVRPVPAVYDSSEYGYARVVRGSFTFSADGHVLWAWDEQLFRPSLQEPFRDSTYSYQTTLVYTVRGADLTIGDECPPDPAANCAPPMSGRLVGTRLILHPA